MSIYLKIATFKGNVTTKGYEQCIEVFNYHQAQYRSVSQKNGVIQNRSAGIVQTSSVRFTKALDEATVALFQHFYEAKVIPEVSFHHLSTGTMPRCYLINTFQNVLISEAEEIHHEQGVMEVFQLHFTAQQKRSMPLNQDLKPASPQTVGYDAQHATVM